MKSGGSLNPQRHINPSVLWRPFSSRLPLLPLLLLIPVLTSGQAPVYDLVLRNGRIIDGTSSPWYKADIAIKGDTIVRIAPRITESASRVVDVTGLVVAPGFIDIQALLS